MSVAPIQRDGQGEPRNIIQEPSPLTLFAMRVFQGFSIGIGFAAVGSILPVFYSGVVVFTGCAIAAGMGYSISFAGIYSVAKVAVGCIFALGAILGTLAGFTRGLVDGFHISLPSFLVVSTVEDWEKFLPNFLKL